MFPVFGWGFGSAVGGAGDVVPGATFHHCRGGNVASSKKLIANSLVCANVQTLMATARKKRFSRRVPDHVTDELVVVLSEETEFLHFNDLFQKVYDNLKKKNAVSGGEEMLRLRAYEKLQNLVSRGMVEKEGRQYLGLDGIERASSKWQAEGEKV